MGNIFQTKDKNEIFPLNGCYTFNYISAASYQMFSLPWCLLLLRDTWILTIELQSISNVAIAYNQLDFDRSSLLNNISMNNN